MSVDPKTEPTQMAYRRDTDTKGHKVWKYMGAVFMEEKNGHQAMSFTRFLGVMLFLFCLGGWSIEMFYPNMVTLPEMAVYTLWSILGVKGGKDVAVGLRGR